MTEIRLPSFNDFSPVILKGDLRPCLKAVVDCGGDDQALKKVWANLYFKGVVNKRSTANLAATLRSTGLSTGARPVELSQIGIDVMNAPTALDAAKLFCGHLLREKNGKLLIEALTAMRKRRARITNASLQDELKQFGVSGLSTNTGDHPALKNWLIAAGLVSVKGDPIDAQIKMILGISATELDEFKNLSLGQQVFLHALRQRHEVDPGPFQSTSLFKECVEGWPHLFDQAQLAKKIRQPLVVGGWITVTGLAGGVHGGRSGNVIGTKKLLDIPLSAVIPDFDQIIPADLRSKLNTPLPELSTDLFGEDTYKAGLALELLALRIIMDLRLEPRHFRLRSAQTAHAEVDLIAEGKHLLFSRWTFQCKRYGKGTSTKLNLGDVAKEVGIAVFARAHVIVMVTTSDFTQDAKDYAQEVTRATHLQFVFINGDLIDEYLKVGRDALWHHFLANANDVMQAKRVQPLPSGQ